MSSGSRPSSGGGGGGGGASGGAGGGAPGGGGGGIRGFFSKLRKPSDQPNGNQVRVLWEVFLQEKSLKND